MVTGASPRDAHRIRLAMEAHPIDAGRGRALADGLAFGWHLHGGVQIPISQSVAIYTQVKHTWVEDDLGNDFDPAFEPIDLGAITYSAGFSFWFE